MRVSKHLRQVTTVFTAVCTSALLATAQQPQNQNPDVIKVTTSLVQTDVMVFDKDGKFVDDLKRDQFVLKVDGKPREISFFERVQAGTSNEESQLAAARGAAAKAGAPVPLDRGRTVFFFIDDLHLSQESTHHTKKLLARFVEREMGQNDQVVFIAASGQIGFLQQLTDNKAVLLKAIERITSRQSKSRDMQSPPMSEYQALQIDQRNEDVKGVYVDYLLRENPMMGRAQAEAEVQGRASAILRFSAAGTTITLSSLQKMVEDFRALPGRKVLFLLSDGFLVNARNSDVMERIRRVTSSAASSSFVVYSIDARGLATVGHDASSPPIIDTSGRMSRGTMGELAASQDGLNALANDTGGRAFFNSNALSAAVTRGLNEASVYYLIAWRPEPEEDRNPKYQRLEVSVVNRPDLFVRSRTGVGEPPSKESKSKQAAADRATEMREALRSVTTQAAFPVEISLNFVNTVQTGDVLVTSTKIATPRLTFADQAGVPTANILVAGLVLNIDGKVVSSFEKILTVRAGSADTKNVPDIHYTSYAALKPGLYQVRVAATDKSGGPIGTAWDWIEITEFSAKTLTLSSLLLGERKTEAEETGMKVDPALDQVQLNVARRFKPSSYLRFTAIIYNAARAAASQAGSGTTPENNTTPGKPDLAVQVQVFRDNEPVVTDPLHKINVDGATDLARIPYAAELNLAGLSRGKYVLQLTVIDRIAKASASQRVRFEVD